MKAKHFAWGVAFVLSAVLVLSTLFVVPEGHVGIQKRFGKAIAQLDPGLQIKIPFVDGVS